MASDTIESRLAQLQEALPHVPAISVRKLKTLHKARDYEGIVRLVRQTMNLDIRLKVGWVNSGGPKENPDAPGWVSLPLDIKEMPYHGTRAFKEMQLTMYFRKSFLETATYDEVASLVAHELSHVVLASIRHPLWKDEKAVDLTAMLLGFRRLYQLACYKERRTGNRIESKTLGYLSRDEVESANRILERRREGAAVRYRYPLAFGAVAASIATAALAGPGYRMWQLHQALAAEAANVQRQRPRRVATDATQVGISAGFLSVTVVFDVETENIDLAEWDQKVRHGVCSGPLKGRISDGASYRFEFRDLARRSSRVEISSCP
jgi:hypothetical protein